MNEKQKKEAEPKEKQKGAVHNAFIGKQNYTNKNKLNAKKESEKERERIELFSVAIKQGEGRGLKYLTASSLY